MSSTKRKDMSIKTMYEKLYGLPRQALEPVDKTKLARPVGFENHDPMDSIKKIVSQTLARFMSSQEVPDPPEDDDHLGEFDADDDPMPISLDEIADVKFHVEVSERKRVKADEDQRKFSKKTSKDEPRKSEKPVKSKTKDKSASSSSSFNNDADGQDE